MNRPPWLLAVVVVAALVAVVVIILGGHEDNVGQILEVVMPVLAALLVIERVDKRSDKQDEKLEENTATIAEVSTSVNGLLTQRLAAAARPGIEATGEVREEQERVAVEKAEDDRNTK